MKKSEAVGKVGISGYEITQGTEGDGRMTIHLTVINYGGDCQTYKDIIDELQNHFKESGRGF